MNTAHGLDWGDFVSLMFQTGYYTLRQDKDGDLYLDYPNDEMRRTYGHELLETYRRPLDPWALHCALADEDHKEFCDLLHTFLSGQHPQREVAARDGLPPRPACAVPADAGRVPVGSASRRRPLRHGSPPPRTRLGHGVQVRRVAAGGPGPDPVTRLRPPPSRRGAPGGRAGVEPRARYRGRTTRCAVRL